MANEITVLDGNGERGYALLLLFPIGTPVTVGSPAANVVPTPSAQLPPLAAQILTGAEKAALDAGTAAFRLVGIDKEAGLTNAQLATRVKAIYAAQLSDFQAWYAAAYRHAGTRLSYP